MIKVALIGNCQGRVIQELIKDHMGETIEFLDIPVIHTIRDDIEKKTEIYQSLKSMDYIISQELSDKFEPLDLPSLKDIDIPLIVIPNAYFKGFHPEMFYFKDYNLLTNRNFMMDYHDIVIFLGYMNNIDKKIITDIFYDKDLYDKVFLDEITTISLNNIKNRESTYDIKISDIILGNDEPSFYSMNHPSGSLLNKVAEKVLQKLGYIGVYTKKEGLLDDVIVPPCASVMNYFNYKNIDTSYRINGKSYDRTEIVVRYYDFYNK